MADPYILYGSYASYYTAKARAYLRKKGVPFVERLPSDPAFREYVRPTSGSHRIPQLLTPEQEVVQDSVAIVDFLEPLFPALPAFPDSPRQRSFVHLMELLGSQGLIRLAWLHRWLFADNQPFVTMDFGRSFRPQGSDAELVKYGQLIADRMMSYGLPESTPEARDALDDQYRALLGQFEAHWIEHPYLLGGHPSAADYALMGALHAHMGRDPAGLRVMQDNAPRTFRWVEHMLVPDLQSPEFGDRPVEYPADDEVPETALALLHFIADHYGEGFVLDSLAFQQAMARQDVAAGHALAPDNDQPFLEREAVHFRGEDREHAADLHTTWVAQRAQTHFQAQPPDGREGIREMLGKSTALDLLEIPVDYAIERQSNRLVVGQVRANAD